MLQNLEPILKYPAVFLAAFAVSWLVTPLARRVALRIGLVDAPGGRRIHEGQIPRTGGVAVFAGFVAGGAVIFLLPWTAFQGQVTESIWLRLVLGAALVVLLGLLDDWLELRPAVKLLGQVAVASLAVAMGFRMGNLVGGGIPPAVDWILSVGWFLLMMNAFNLIDGMDGLATGLALVSALGLAASLVLRHAPGDVLLFLSLAGSCAAFLRFNFHPASIFLGDCGSLFLGFVLAALTLGTQSKGPALAVLGGPLFAMGVPLLDTLLAVWRRSMGSGAVEGQKQGFFKALARADQNHLHHRLMRGGLTQRRAALLLYAGGLLSSLVGVLLVTKNSYANGLLVIALVGLLYVVFRHVAVVELRESGRAVLRGVARPSTRNSGAQIYAVVDAAILMISLAASVLIADSLFPEALDVRRTMARILPGFWALPMIALVLCGAYSRVWSLARVAEFLLVGIALAAAIVAGAGQIVLAHGKSVPMLPLLALLHAGLSLPFVVGSRGVVRVAQDVLALTHRIGFGVETPPRRILVAGPCAHAAMLLRLLSTAPPPGYDHCEVAGILDDDPAFHHRRVQGVRTLGALADLPGVVGRTGADEVIVVGADAQGTMERLRAEHGGLPLRWRSMAFALSEPRP